MSVVQTIPHGSRLPQAAHPADSLVFTWSTTPSNGSGARRFCVRLETLDPHRGLIDAWLDDGPLHQVVMPRQPVRIRETIEEDLRHVEALADIGGQRLLTVTLLLEAATQMRILYIATPLLTRSGLRGGAYHPPTLAASLKDRGQLPMAGA